MRKKILSFLLCAALLASIPGLMHASAADANELRFASDGAFKILQIADLQDGNPLDIRVRRFIQAMLETEKPDLVVLTGDNIQGAITGIGSITQERKDAATKEAIAQFMDIIARSKIPVAVVFGNHDTEGSVYIGRSTGKAAQLAMYQAYPNCLMIKQDPTYTNQNLSGVGNYNLPILSKDGSSKAAYNLWFFDAFDSGSSKPYDGVHDDVLDWYTWKSNQLKEANGGAWLPAISFQHIVVPEVETAMTASGLKVDTSVPGDTDNYIWEDPCPNYANDNQFAKMKDRDVKAMIFGHDHDNHFRIPYQGVDLICTAGACFGDRGLQILLSYNRAHDAMARLITLHEDEPGNIESKTLRYSVYKDAGLIRELPGEGVGEFGMIEQILTNVMAVLLSAVDKLLIALWIV